MRKKLWRKGFLGGILSREWDFLDGGDLESSIGNGLMKSLVRDGVFQRDNGGRWGEMDLCDYAVQCIECLGDTCNAVHAGHSLDVKPPLGKRTTCGFLLGRRLGATPTTAAFAFEVPDGVADGGEETDGDQQCNQQCGKWHK